MRFYGIYFCNLIVPLLSINSVDDNVMPQHPKVSHTWQALSGKVTIPRVMKCIRLKWWEEVFPLASRLPSHHTHIFFASTTHFIQTPVPCTFQKPYPTKVASHGWFNTSVLVPLPGINLDIAQADLFAGCYHISLYVSVTCKVFIVTMVWFWWMRCEGHGLGKGPC